MKMLPLNKQYRLFFLFFGVASFSSPAVSSESIDRWMTAEFNRQWGLESIEAHYAYARGYNGQGVNIGIFDESVFTHPEFKQNLNKFDMSEPYNFSDIIEFGDHGTHVAGIAAAARNGQGMHGVAYGAGIVSAKTLDSEVNFFEKSIQSDVRIFNNSWGSDVPIEEDSDGNPIILPNGTPAYIKITKQDVIDEYTMDDINLIESLSHDPIPSSKIDTIGRYAALVRAARYGKLIVFAAGNENNYNIPTSTPIIPYFFPDVLNNFIITVNLNEANELDVSSTSCGYSASYCVAAPGTNIYSTTAQTDYVHYEQTNDIKIIPGYGESTGTSMAAPMVSGAAAVLMQRFPYMTSSQIATVLLTTATDIGAAGVDTVYGWGKINLRKAIDGPKMFVTKDDIPTELYIDDSYAQTQFIVNIPGIHGVIESDSSNQRICSSIECGYDKWTNDINGHGGLTKVGAGTLELTGNNTYLGPTIINQGTLFVNGLISSSVNVQHEGILAGSGSVGSLIAKAGGNVAPSNPDGILKITNDLSFEQGSHYTVEIESNGKNDKLQNGGVTLLHGGDVTVLLKKHENLLSQGNVYSFLSQRYNILNAKKGINGQFDSVTSSSLFLGSELNYQPEQVILNITRNDTSFASVTQTQNERSVAVAVDNLSAGNPVHESILDINTADDARLAFRQLSGQIHADIASELMNNSRHLRETLNERLRQASGRAKLSSIQVNDDGAWGQQWGTWSQAGKSNTSGYHASTYGFLFGIDSVVTDDWQLGGAAGYTRTSLNGGGNSNANSNSHHLAIFSSKQFGQLALRTGGSYSWHRINTTRTVSYGMQSDHNTAKYNSRMIQLFSDVSYNLKNDEFNLEPFVNLANITLNNGVLSESGGAASLHGDKRRSNATISTLGLRADAQLQASKSTNMALRSELGWQHAYGEQERNSTLQFNSGRKPFVVGSIPMSRDALVLKAGVETVLNNNATLSLSYGGLLSPNHHDNSINVGFTWSF